MPEESRPPISGQPADGSAEPDRRRVPGPAPSPTGPVGKARSVPQSFRFAFEGLGALIRRERNAQIHLVMTGIVIAVATWCRVSAVEWALLILVMGLVLAAEALNAALEAAVDLSTETWHPLAKRAKDQSAAAVLLAAATAAIVGVVILGPPVVTHLRPWWFPTTP